MRIDEIYTEIGQTIVDLISDDWLTAQLDINRLEKYISVKGVYKDKNGLSRQIDDSDFGYLFSLKIHELHTLMNQESKNPWNKLKFILYPTGNFEVEFIWDKEYLDEVDRWNNK